MSKIHLTSLSLSELEDWMRALGEEGYRARQIFQGIYKQGQSDCSQFTNLPLRLREKLNHRFVIKLLERQEEYLSADGTIKYVFKLSDGNYIETVVIPSGVRQTVCLSTQVGCKFRCAFCASGLKGFKRNLSAGEIVSQVLILKHQLNHQINNLVFMGMGEPLDNLHEVIKAIRILNDKQGMDIGARRITVSTAGIVPGIKKLKDLNLQINLSISIHSPFDRQRTELMPINQKYPLA
ncbi:MAG: 23S rRNA (adenine(2503)-C(2))-methyltransferase RlmN, partial [Candidatus Saccharicenans sp.]|nr:23S rRNA (adenine(2503)-C(2))-methyltransferase RlmN [Candidatus Saccharicenans sp.]